MSNVPLVRRRSASGRALSRLLRELEAPLIAATLATTRGNQIKAAEVLGLNRNTFERKFATSIANDTHDPMSLAALCAGLLRFPARPAANLSQSCNIVAELQLCASDDGQSLTKESLQHVNGQGPQEGADSGAQL